MPKCHKIYPNCIRQALAEGQPWGFTQLFLLNFTGIMPLILYEYALHRSRHKPPNWILMISATFKSTSAPKQWLVGMIFPAIILLHLQIHSSKKFSLISLHVPTLISLIISPTNIPRMMNQSILSTLQFLHFIPTIQLIFFNCFYTFLFFCNSKIFTTTAGYKIYKRAAGRERPTTLKEGSNALHFQKTARCGDQLQLLPPFLDSPGGKQPEPLPVIKAGQ